MILRMFDWCLGYYMISTKTEFANVLRDLMHEFGVHYWGFSIQKETVSLCVSAFHWKRRKDIFQKLETSQSEICGLPKMLVALWARKGILFGSIMMGIFLLFSSRVVWDIQVTGNVSLDDDQILKELSDVGFSIGSFCSADFDQLRNEFLMKSRDVAWLSVNMEGVVAKVEVREYLADDLATKDVDPCNIVASKDGQVALISVVEGKRCVEIGQVVKAGDLLISGVIDSQSLGVRYEHAEGEVMAYVNKEIFVEQLFEIQEKHYTGRTYKKISLNLFGKNINIFSNCGNSVVTCDKIEDKKQVCFLGRFDVPVWICTEDYREYDYVSRTLTPREAIDVAFSSLRLLLDRSLLEAELISKNVRVSHHENMIRIQCNLYCLEDIAEKQKFQISQQ